MRNCFLPSSSLKHIGNLMNKGGEQLKQAAKAAEKMEPKIASHAERFTNKIKQNFTEDKLNAMAKKLEKYSGATIGKIKEVATALLHELDKIMRKAFKETGKVVNPQNINDFMAKVNTMLKQAFTKTVEKSGPTVASTAEKFAQGVRNFTEKHGRNKPAQTV